MIGGLIQIRIGNPLNGALFSSFGAFWVALAAILQWFSKDIPAAQVRHAVGLMLYTFAILAAIFLLCSLRTTLASVVALTTSANTSNTGDGSAPSPRCRDPAGRRPQVTRAGPPSPRNTSRPAAPA